MVGVVVGGLASNVGDFLKSPQAQDLITKLGGVEGLRDAFLAVELGFAGVFAAVFGVQATMRLRSEETALRAEPLLATAVGRIDVGVEPPDDRPGWDRGPARSSSA